MRLEMDCAIFSSVKELVDEVLLSTQREVTGLCQPCLFPFRVPTRIDTKWLFALKKYEMNM